ncbi:hypothetical protein BGZ95_011926 [Linnemannia exigua]|uniref:Uncharacterized protein n=1 Tax=Linnemannia exigua TaxID=604196 RepID=A0AAD4H3X3_9FUNG|nr:hypothetical protein BGZ95_011926 [Linnemannia exigua]
MTLHDLQLGHSEKVSFGKMITCTIMHSISSISTSSDSPILAHDSVLDQETKTTKGAQWMRIGSPIYNIDRETRTVVTSEMITRPKSVPSKSVGGDPLLHDHEILIYNPVDLTSPIARCGSEIWQKDKKGDPVQPWYHPFTLDMMQVAQVVKIKHYPKTIEKGNMRVVVCIAFGQRAHPLVNNATDSHILGVWLMIKVIEVWVPAHPWVPLITSMMNDIRYDPSVDEMTLRSCIRINPDDVINYETLEPRQNQTTVHGRIVKLYSADEPPPMGGQKMDGMEWIALRSLGSDMVSAIAIEKPISRDGESYADKSKKTYSNKAICRGVSCMGP